MMGNHTVATMDMDNFNVVGGRQVHLFRTTSAGCVELSRKPAFPLARLSTNGEWGNEVGLSFSAEDLLLLAEFLTAYAKNMKT
jgi:hypothetical protein